MKSSEKLVFWWFQEELKLMNLLNINWNLGTIPGSLKSFDKTTLKNCIFISKSLKRLLPLIFKSCFKFFFFESRSDDTRWSNFGYLKILSNRTKTRARYSLFANVIYLESLTKLPSKCNTSSFESKWIEKDINYFFPK